MTSTYHGRIHKSYNIYYLSTTDNEVLDYLDRKLPRSTSLRKYGLLPIFRMLTKLVPRSKRFEKCGNIGANKAST